MYDKRSCIHSCITCHRTIQDEPYIKCLVCHGFNQCLECFAVGKTAGTHLKTHKFALMESALQPIFSSDWSCENELMLLEGVSRYGVGNWVEVSDFVKTKSKLECEAHYKGIYMNETPIPDVIVKREPRLPPPYPFDTRASESRPSIGHERNLLNKREKTTPAEFAGYMPKRDEFETEYHNDAEYHLNSMVFQQDEEPAEFYRKVKLLESYNELLKERELRGSIAKEYGLLDHDIVGIVGSSRKELELESKLLPLSLVMPKQDLIELIKVLIQEMQYKDQIKKRVKWIKHGITTREEGPLFEQISNIIEKDRVTPAAIEKWSRDVKQIYDNASSKTACNSMVLSFREKNFCVDEGITPKLFLELKEIIVPEKMVHPDYTDRDFLHLSPSDPEIVCNVYRFLESTGCFAPE